MNMMMRERPSWSSKVCTLVGNDRGKEGVS